MFDSRHPKALPYLFLTEMWERFGFYVVQGMLVLYMANAFGFSDNDSYTIMGVFSALAYIAPFIGGSLADRVLGFKTAIILGGVLLSVGYALLALPWSSQMFFSASSKFYLSLATIIVGNGLFKPNISSLLGTLYAPDDPNRDSGFTIFYMGINLGVLLAGISSGYIKSHFGWNAGFGLASVGLIIGLITFAISLHRVAALKESLQDKKILSLPMKLIIILSLLILIGLISLLFQSQVLAKWLLPTVGSFLLIYLLVVVFQQEREDRKPLLSLLMLIISSIVFWMLFLQMFFSASLFIERLVDRDWFWFSFPTTYFYALEAVFVIMLGPLFAWSWQSLNRSHKNPAPFSKFILAIVFAGLGFVCLVLGTYLPQSNQLVNPLWVVVAYLCITIGEMFLSPIGLSAVTTLAPRHLVGMMMGVWFVAMGFGGQFAGWLATLSNVPENVTDLSTQLIIYRHAFQDFALLAFTVAFILWFLKESTRRVL